MVNVYQKNKIIANELDFIEKAGRKKKDYAEN